MKSKNFLKLFAIIFFAAIFASCNGSGDNKTDNSDPEFKVGDAVCAKWSGSWLEAKIISINGDKYKVKFYDDYEDLLSASEIKRVLKKSEVKKGDKVYAVWTSHKYYPGTVQELKDDGAIIKWDDGSNPSLAKYGLIAEK